MLEAALVGWLVAVLGDRALKGLTVLALGKPERAALTAAMGVVTAKLLDRVSPEAREPLKRALEEIFRKPPVIALNGAVTVKTAIIDGIIAQVSPLADASITPSGRSFLSEIGVDDARLTAELPDLVIRSIQQVGAGNAALHPLAAQLDEDSSEERDDQILVRADQILDAVQALAIQSRDVAGLQQNANPATGPIPVDLLEPVIDAIMLVPAMGDYSARMAIINSLRPIIRDNISRSSIARVEILNTIATCRNYEGGLSDLVSRIGLIEGDSEAMRHLKQVILGLARNEAVRRQLEGEADR